MNGTHNVLLTNLPGYASDGWHTFDELYEHRVVLFIVLVLSHPHLSWWSRRHDDGSMFEDYIIAGMELPVGPIGYHVKESYIPLLAGKVRELEFAPQWDGAGSKETIGRLTSWAGMLSMGAPDK